MVTSYNVSKLKAGDTVRIYCRGSLGPVREIVEVGRLHKLPMCRMRFVKIRFEKEDQTHPAVIVSGSPLYEVSHSS